MLDFPVQLIPKSEKTEEWHRKHLDIFVFTMGHPSQNLDKQIEYDNYNTYNGIEKESLKTYLTAPYGKKVRIKYKVWPLARQKVRQLVSDFMRRPLKKKVTAVNKDAENRKEKKRLDLSLAKAIQDIEKDLEAEFGFPIAEPQEQQQMEIPEDIDMFIDMTYREASEVALQIGVDYLLWANKLKEQFKYGCTDVCINFKAFFKVYILGGDPYWRRIDPRNCYYDLPYDSEFIDEANWFVEERWLNLNEITLEYELKHDEVIKLSEAMRSGTGSQLGQNYGSWFSRTNHGAWDSFKIRVLTMEWKSQAMKKVKISPNKHNPNQPFYKRVEDTYEPRKNERVETRIVDEIRECTLIGNILTKNWGLVENQVRSVDNPEKASLSYVGLVGDATTDVQHSLVSELEYLQDFASDILFTIKKVSKKLGKRAAVYDAAQIPKQFLKKDKNGNVQGIKAVMHHLDEDQLIVINSKDDANRGKPHSFNQFTEINLSPSGDVTELVNLLMLIDDLASRISGIAPQREGQNQKYETASANQSAIISSNNRTEIYLKPYANLIQRVIEKAINLAKIAWCDGKKSRFFMGDGATAVLNVLPDVALNDYGFFMNDGIKDLEIKETINMAAMNFLNGSSEPRMVLEMIKVFKQDTAEEAEEVLNKGLERLEQIQNEMKQAEMQSTEAIAERNAELEDRKLDIEEKKIASAEKVAKIKYDQALDVAEIYSGDTRDVAAAKEKSSILKEKMKEKIASQKEVNKE